MPLPKDPNWSELAFPVSLRSVYVDGYRGEYRPVRQWKSVFREDTGECLALVSRNYKLIPHHAIFQPLHGLIQEHLPFPISAVSTQIGFGGGVAVVEWILEHKMPVELGDLVAISIIARNSINMRSRLSVELAGLRLKCWNGLRAADPKRYRLSWKHYTKLNQEKALHNIQHLLSLGTEMVDQWKNWTQVRIFPQTMEAWLKNDRRAVGLLGKKARGAMFDRMAGRGERGRKITLWEAYNALTETATHHVKTRQPELILAKQELIHNLATRFANTLNQN